MPETLTALPPGVVVCRPPSFPIRHILNCPTCKQRRRMAGRDATWYGPTLTCLGCGDSWTCGEMHGRPFQRAWRAKSIAAAKRAWDEAGRYTRADHKAWLAEELAASAADWGSSIQNLELPTAPAASGEGR